MTSDADRHRIMAAAPILWITGLAGTGKSTLARALVDSLQHCGQRPLLLDGDDLRICLETEAEQHDHRPATRLLRAWRLARLARLASQQGVPVIVATISLFHVIHVWNRDGDSPYAEVLLDADPRQLRQRRPALYGSDHAAGVEHVVGVDIVAEFPSCPELVLPPRSDGDDAGQRLRRVLALWERLDSPESTR